MLLNQMNVNENLVEFYKQNNLKFIIDKNGNVGINVIEPEYNLHIGGDINCSNIYINDENLLTIVDTNLNNTSNDLYDYTTWNFERARNFNTFAYNSTLVDFTSITTTESYVINSSNYTDTHYCVYYKNLFDSELLIQADFPYIINGYGSDHYSSRIAVISEANIEPEYSIEHEQIFIGYAAGGGTRSTTLSPINHKTSIFGNVVTIKVQLRAIDSDDSILTDKCVFIITEKKPTSKLVLTKYITPADVIELTSNLYLTTPELNDILVNYQTNDYGKWESNTDQSIYFNIANVGIGISNPNNNYNLDVSGIINCDNLYLNNINILDTIDSRIDFQSNILDDKIILNVNQLNTKINSLNSDYIYNGNINRFIVNDIYDRDIHFKTNVYASNIITCNLSVIGENTTFLTSIYQTEQLEIVNDTTSTSLIIKQMTPLQNVAEFYNGENLSLLIDSNGNIDINGSVNCSNLFINKINLVDNFNENIYLTSNDLINFTNETFSRLQNSNLVGFNSTLVDFKSIITSNVFIVNSSNYINTHTCTYHKFFPDSEVLIQADFPYKINGFGSDHYSSRLEITSELNQTPEYSVEHEQIFIGYAAGGGTRSATLSPLSHKTDIQGLFINITVQMRLIDSDDSIYSDKCVFIITEKKPSSRLIFSHYLNEADIPRLTSNLYISPDELSETLLSYESNIYGKWTSNINSRDIYYEALDANIGIGTSTPSFKLDINGNLNCSELFRNGVSLENTLDYFINEDELNAREYVNSNNIRNYINSNIIGYNSTLVDFSSIISLNTYIVNSSN